MRFFETVSTTTARIVFNGNDVATSFSTDFVFLDEGDLVVTLVDANGVETVQTLTTHYTVTGGNGNTGSVEMVTAPASGETLVVERLVAYTQDVDLLSGDPFNADTIETRFDKFTMVDQQLLDLANLAVQAPKTRNPAADTLTLPEPEDGKLLRGKSDLSGWENVELSDLDSTAFTSPLPVLNGGTGATTAAAARSSLGALVDTFDDDLADDADTAKGDALVGVKRTATGAVATTVHDWMDGHPWFRAQADFGATGDGSTDDTAALQAAIDAAEANGGGTVALEPGAYVHSGLKIDSSHVAFVGLGEKRLGSSNGVVLLYDNTTGDHLDVEQASEVRIENISFDLEGSVGTPTAGAVIKLEQTGSGIQQCVVRNVRILGGFNGIDVIGVNKPILENVHIQDIVGNFGIKFSATGGARIDLATLRDIFFNSNVSGGSTVTDGLVLGEEVHSVFCENAHFQKALVGVRLRDDGAGFSSAPQFVKFVDTEVENANSDGWRFEEARHVEMVNCFAGSNGANGIHLTPSINDYGFVMTSCLAVANQNSGLFVEGNGHYCIVQGSRFMGNDAAGSDFDGIRVAAGVGSFQFIGNRCGGGNSGDPSSTPQKYGINVLTGASDDYIISLNDLRGNGTAGLTDNGSGSNKVVANNIS